MKCIVLFDAVIEITTPPATELSLTRKTPSVARCAARILLALSRVMAEWYQAWDLCTVAWVSVNLSATGAATRRLKLGWIFYNLHQVYIIKLTII